MGFAVATASVALLGGPAEVRAQDGFLFDSPGVQLSFRGGAVVPALGGDLFDFFSSELTLDRSDFRTWGASGEIALLPHPQLSVALGYGRAKGETRSEFRDWIGEDGLPIEQVTRVRISPATATARYYLRPRGRQVGTIAWVPAGTTPYVGGGLSWTHYSVTQTGEFVDFEDLSIFGATLESSGGGVSAHVVGGLDHWITPHFGLNAEARYSQGSVRPSGQFDRYDSLGLGGFELVAGLSFRW